MKIASDMYRFSSKLWINNRAVSKNGDVSLYLQVVIDGKHKEFPIGLRWPLQNIDLVSGRLKARHKNDAELNTYNVQIINALADQNEINNTFLRERKTLTIEIFSKKLKYFNDRESLLAFLDREGLRRVKDKEIDKITKKSLQALIIQIANYKEDVKFSDLNRKWVLSFKNHLTSKEYSPGKRYKPSTVWGFMKVLKTYLKLAAQDELIYVDPEAHTFENPEPIPETEYLDREELRRLLILYRSGVLTILQANVLKAFLFQCYTGLRISDIYNANNTWRFDDDYLLFLPHKNRKKNIWLKIPLMGPAKEIIRNSVESFFQLPNQAQFNETLKELAAKAQIAKNLKSHMGRHTFGFMFMTSVGNIYALQKLLGHKLIEATQRYAHLNDDYKLKAVREMADSFNDYTI